ncbi:MAG: GNAT family N-acetyltransferase [Pyrinomonadaceae bacterium]
MSPLVASEETTAATAAAHLPSVAADSLTISLLTGKDQSEVLAFLSQRPLHTVVMASMIQDNGLLSPLNRGTFYACRNEAGQLVGVALIGHATLLETRTEAALQAFAELARRSQNKHVIMGEQEKIERFWNYYAGTGQDARLLCRELLFEQRWPVEVRETVRGLRQATLDDLELVMPVQAQMAFEESGVNPMESDPTGFRLRCARRIEQGRVWVWVENGRLIFKADIIARTPQASYVEGVYVNPEDRGRGYGLRCMSQLSRTLLARTGAVCLLVNEKNREAQEFYLKAGYKLRSHYDTIFLQQ